MKKSTGTKWNKGVYIPCTLLPGRLRWLCTRLLCREPASTAWACQCEGFQSFISCDFLPFPSLPFPFLPCSWFHSMSFHFMCSCHLISPFVHSMSLWFTFLLFPKLPPQHCWAPRGNKWICMCDRIWNKCFIFRCNVWMYLTFVILDGCFTLHV